MSMTVTARNEYAKIMTAHAKKFLAEGLVTWKGQDDMIRMIRGDASDFRKIGRLLREMGGASAFWHANNMDTDARDNIPDQVWDALVQNEDVEALTRREWSDDITRRSIAVLEGRRDAINNEIERAKARLNHDVGK